MWIILCSWKPQWHVCEKINYCEVVISTDQEKEDIMNILNELEEEFPGLVSDDVKANAGELVAKYQ